MPKTEQPTREDQRVEDWRELVLLRAGYPPDDAIQLARRGEIDLHAACDLLARGCTVETALQILL